MDEPDEEPRVIETSEALATLSRAEIDSQVATARRYPRSIKKFREDALALATLDEDTASSMLYAIVRGGKRIEGPSVRLAEVAGSSWGNLYYGARVVEIGDRTLKAQGVAWDLEKNVKAAIEVTRRITTRQGKRYDDDMITVTGNAASSIALRNAIWKVIPGALIKPIYEAAKAVAIGQGLSMEHRRQRALDWFGKLGIKSDKVFKLLGRRGVEDITVEDLVTLQGLKTAIQDGDTTVDQAFTDAETPAPMPGATGSKLDALADALKGNGKAPDVETEPPVTDENGQVVIPS